MSGQEIATEMGISLAQVRYLAGSNYEMLSLEQPLSKENTGSLADILEDQEAPVLDSPRNVPNSQEFHLTSLSGRNKMHSLFF